MTMRTDAAAKCSARCGERNISSALRWRGWHVAVAEEARPRASCKDGDGDEAPTRIDDRRTAYVAQRC